MDGTREMVDALVEALGRRLGERDLAAAREIVAREIAARLRRPARRDTVGTVLRRVRVRVQVTAAGRSGIMARSNSWLAAGATVARERRSLLAGLLVVGVAATVSLAIALTVRSRRRAGRSAVSAAPVHAVAIQITPSPSPAVADRGGAGANDELRAIRGIGPETSKHLRDAGVTSLQQIAAWGPEEVRRMAELLEVSPGRIEREDWVGQARAATRAPSSTT